MYARSQQVIGATAGTRYLFRCLQPLHIQEVTVNLLYIEHGPELNILPSSITTLHPMAPFVFFLPVDSQQNFYGEGTH